MLRRRPDCDATIAVGKTSAFNAAKRLEAFLVSCRAPAPVIVLFAVSSRPGAVMRKRCVILFIALLGIAGQGVTLDPNFQETPYATVGSQVTGIAWAPDGSNRLFVTRKMGEIQIVKNGVLLPQPFATVSPVYSSGECGLIGICFDPNFIVNGHVYVFATVSSSEEQIIRYTAVADVGTNKTVLISDLPTGGSIHNGGAIGVGPDGKLYWGVGDNGIGLGVDDDLISIAAKIGRANLDGSIPADNPFVDGPDGANDYIWARGFRNPYTITFHPDSGAMWVNDVGTAYEQIFLVNAGDHAGWNNYENTQPSGFITPKIKYRTNGTDTRNITPDTGAARTNNVATFTTTVTHGFRQGEKITIAGVSDSSFNNPVFVTSVPSPTMFTAAQPGPDTISGGGTATTLNQGRAVLGGCFFDSTAVPAAYRGNFFYGDYGSGRVMRATLNASNEVTSVDYFGTNITNYIDNAVGPDGALYYARHNGAIFRLAYTNLLGPELIVTPTVVRMMEGGAAAITICLATMPDTDVEVTASRTSGVSNVLVSSGATLTFTPTNWFSPQVVQLAAMADIDSTNDTAGLTVSASGLAPQTITVHVVDLPAGPFSLWPVIYSEAQTFQLQLNGQPGLTYVLEETTNLATSWMPLDTNTLIGASTNLTDPASTNFPLRFYRARLLQ
jgi:glucose/arabinose dehydrogenase